MTYVISDLHGQMDSYEKLLKKIKFTDNDTLYLLGDMIDYGDGGIELLMDAMSRPNVFPMLGEHEYMALRLLTRLRLQESGKKPQSSKFQEEFALWLQMGGMPTVTAFRALENEDQESILEYLREECTAYEIAEIGDKSYLLVHAGVPADASEDTLDDVPLLSLIRDAEATFPMQAPSGMILVTGHVPTERLDEENGGRALISEHHIAIDCGAEDGGFACCLCLDTGECYYA